MGKTGKTNDVSRETSGKGFSVSVADADDNGTQVAPESSVKIYKNKSYRSLYRHFRENGLTRLESAYNALFFTADKKLGSDDCVANHNLFRHPKGWFKDRENQSGGGMWKLVHSILLAIPRFSVSASKIPSAIGCTLSELGEGLDSSTKLARLAGNGIKKYGLSLIAVLCAAGMGVYMYCASAVCPTLELYVDGERIGVVKSKDVYYAGVNTAEDSLSKLLGISYKIPGDTARFKVINESNPEYVSDTQVAASLMKSAEKYIATGYGLYIDDTLVAVSSSHMIMEKILNDTLELYNSLYSSTKDADEILSFANSVTIKETTVPKNVIKGQEEIRNILGLDSLGELNDLLLRNDSPYSPKLSALDVSLMLPEIEGITSADISHELPEESVYFVDSAENDAAANSDFADESDAAPGDAGEILGEGETTVLTFKTVETKTFTEIMPCDVQYVYDSDILEGRKIISSAGVDGIKRATYEISYVGDKEIGRTLISQEVIKKPVTKKIKIGTRPSTEYDAETSVTGTFIMPCNGTITSTFAGRTLFGAYEFHGALDICSTFGTPIRATDGGEVVFVGRNGTYGKCIIIDHGDGIESLYAHLSEYAVEVGDKVGQGWKIGEMGNTGRVTGVHLHFEVRVNGVRQDPMDYLNQ